jgi:hypothetical protein
MSLFMGGQLDRVSTGFVVLRTNVLQPLQCRLGLQVTTAQASWGRVGDSDRIAGARRGKEDLMELLRRSV